MLIWATIHLGAARFAEDAFEGDVAIWRESVP
jgi:hypothetical protein